MASGGVDCAELGSAAALLDPSVADESAGAPGGAAVVPLVADALGGAVLADTSPLTVALSEGALAVEGGSLVEVFESSAERSREVERVEAARWEDFVAT